MYFLFFENLLSWAIGSIGTRFSLKLRGIQAMPKGPNHVET